MIARAPAAGWCVLTAAACLAAVGPLAAQLGFAVLAVGVIGMAHGASDLAIVARARRPAFLTAYAAVSLLCLAWWITRPALALPLFLGASAVHFAMEDAPHGSWRERTLRGMSLIATPATLHPAQLHMLLHVAAGGDAVSPAIIAVMATIGGIAAAVLIATGVARRDLRLVGGTMALLLFPPLIGFALGFLILHALPQTSVRRARIGCATMSGYLRATAPIMAAAIAVFALVTTIVLRLDDSGIRGLFAAIAALAMPHLLVTPWFSQKAHALTKHTMRGHIAIDSLSQYH
ncbi:Brp/Blh family beta-carotene 15,15'-dioxygenase [Sphingomonas sp.]|uniref:Brp/Blh family beta-carotene 15,15'-dioxygenase n=1 Tax=Sphingomonas sp. TaxID=28214 RepID=UPI00258ED687|nr:Brp/Blh family beta-carotene 15,15'-dioxygenase [Sphingomonas sp.]